MKCVLKTNPKVSYKQQEKKKKAYRKADFNQVLGRNFKKFPSSGKPE